MIDDTVYEIPVFLLSTLIITFRCYADIANNKHLNIITTKGIIKV